MSGVEVGRRGVYARHSRSCHGKPCTCSPSYRAKVWDGANRRFIKRTFRSIEAAQTWHARVYAEVSVSPRATRERDEREARALKAAAGVDLSQSYSHLRKAQQALDRVVIKAQPPLRGVVREALSQLYVAEDTLKEVL